jgi:chromosome segregation ATPase
LPSIARRDGTLRKSIRFVFRSSREGSMTTDNTIADAAFAVSTAHAHVQRASAELAAANAQYDQIAERVAALDATRAEIIARRQRGNLQPDDGAQLELAAADREGLSGILAEAEAVVTAARGPGQEARQALSEAQRGLQIAEDTAAMGRLVEHAGRLDALMLATTGQIAEVQARLGHTGRPAWAPSAELYRELRKLTAAVGGL